MIKKNLRDTPDLKRLRTFFRTFKDDESGGIIILTLLLLITTLVVGGMAVDFMNNEHNRVYLQGVADRSVISAAALSQDIDGDTVVEDFFEKSGVGSSIIGVPNFVDSGNSKTVSVEAINDIPTFYLRLIGIDELEAIAASTATEGIGKVEISLVVDVSASMRSGGSAGSISPFNPNGGRINDLRIAAQAFADIVLDPNFAGQVSLNIVPFAGQTNPGPEVFALLGGTFDDDNTITIPYSAILPGTNAPVGVIQPNPRRFIINGYPEIQPMWTTDPVAIPLYDVEGNPILRPNGDHITNQDINQVKAHLSGNPNFDPDTPDGPTIDMMGRYPFADPATGMLMVEYTPPNSCFEMDEPTDWTTSGPPAVGQDAVPNFMVYGFQDWEITSEARNWGWCPDDETRIKYGLDTPDDATDYLAGLSLFDGTGTDYAMKWGLATLDPAMRPIFAALNAAGVDVPDDFANRPADYTDPETQKILVLMTDGQVTGQIRPAGAQDDPRLLLNLSPVNASLPSAWIGSVLDDVNGRITAKTRDDARDDLIGVCGMAKANGVEVFTVAFEYQANSATDEQVMRDCATPNTPGRTYYYATSGAGLTTVFSEIAEQVSQLRLTQ